MKLLVDMNLSERWIPVLANAGIVALHWSAIGKADAPDVEIMAYAKTHNYVILTHDLDFSAILAVTHGDKPSVVQIRSGDVSPNVIGKEIIQAVKQMRTELEAGALKTDQAAFPFSSIRLLWQREKRVRPEHALAGICEKKSTVIHHWQSYEAHWQ